MLSVASDTSMTLLCVRFVADPGTRRTSRHIARQPTYFTAFGRDVDVPESLLAYDPACRRLTVAGGGRKVEKAARHQADLIDALRTVEMSGVVPPPWNTETIETIGASAGMSRGDVRAGRKAAVAAGDLIVSKGDRNAVLHALSDTGRGVNPPVRRSPP